MSEMNNKNILVSIICNVFNHENYLEQTLDGFVMQKTDFAFEILIHDDCSSDNSKEIIERYAAKYPELFKPIYQSENQYSKGINITQKFQYPRAEGKYIALCEGDDCWIDELKLQKQIGYMESHPDCTFCFSNGLVHNCQNGSEQKFIPYTKNDEAFIKEDGVYNVGELAKLSFLPTCSFIFHKENLKKLPEAFYTRVFCGDRKVTLFFTSLGYAYCLNDCTCKYNYAVPNSALTRFRTKKELVKIEKSFIFIHNAVNDFTSGKYKEELEQASIPYLKNIYFLSREKDALTEHEYKLIKSDWGIKDSIKKFVLTIVSDKAFNYLRKIKKKLGK